MANTKNHALLPDQKIFALIIGLCEEISKADSATDAANLLGSLLTPQEIRMLAIRLRIRGHLLDDEGYQNIRDELGVSFGTISRVRLSLEHLDKRPRSANPSVPFDAYEANTIEGPTSIRPKGPMAKYSSNGWPIQLLATVIEMATGKRPP